MKEIEWTTIKRVATDTASAREREEVARWAGASEERRRFLADATAYYREEVPSSARPPVEAVERAWKRVKPRESRRRRFVAWAGVAAMIAGIVLGTLLLPRPAGESRAPSPRVQLTLSDGSVHELPAVAPATTRVPGFTVDTGGRLAQAPSLPVAATARPHEIVVPRGGEYSLTLADGSHVLLNSESTLRFPASFEGAGRKVFLRGEAYFEVARDAARPFVVEIEGATVRVTGTCFNVKAHATTPACVTLLSGSVNVGTAGDTLALRPGQQCEILPGTRLVAREADMVAVLAWKNGEFVFKDAPLGEIMDELARWYDMKVVYEQPGLAATRLYIYVERGVTLQEVLDKIALTGKITYTIEGNRVRVKSR